MNDALVVLPGRRTPPSRRSLSARSPVQTRRTRTTLAAAAETDKSVSRGAPKRKSFKRRPASRFSRRPSALSRRSPRACETRVKRLLCSRRSFGERVARSTVRADYSRGRSYRLTGSLGPTKDRVLQADGAVVSAGYTADQTSDARVGCRW